MNIFNGMLRNCLLLLMSFFLQTFAEGSTPLKRLAALEKRGVQVSALVMRMGDDKILAQMSSETHLIPASTTKLIVASQALETWGADKTFTSFMLRRGEIHNRILEGDLIFYGGGDPALTNEKLEGFAADVARAGIKKVTGKLIVNNSLFGNLIQDRTRRSAQYFSQNAYDSPLSSSAVNYSVIGLIVLPGKQTGAKAKVALELYELPSVSVVNSVKTTPAGSKTHLNASRNTRHGKDIYTIDGTIALDASEQRVYRSVSNAERYAGEVIAAHLQNAGIDIDETKIDFESTPPLLTDKIVTSVNGSPLFEQLSGLLNLSNNFIADMLLLNLSVENAKNQSFAAKSEKSGKSTLQIQSATLQNYMQSISGDKNIVLQSGSGLTVENRLSAKNLVSLLKRVYTDGNKFDIFLSSLATPGQIGALQERFKKISAPDAKVFLRAKTGTLSEPYPVVSLAGYSRTSTNDWVSFAVIMNGTKSKHSNTKNSPGIEELRRALDADLTDFLQAGTSSL